MNQMHSLKFRTMFSTTLRCTFCFPHQKSLNPKKPFCSSSSVQYPKQEAQVQPACWSGLDNWRNSPLNDNRFWGPNGPQQSTVLEENGESVTLHSCSSLAEMGTVVLSTADPLTKSKLSHLAFTRWFEEGLPIGIFEPPHRPARPPKPQLRLAELGFSYGDMPAHNLLWRECDKTSGNVAARLAAIPLVQEARGLDAGPRLVKKLIGFGDHRTSNIVARIADEEVAHVAVGLYWFLSVCQKMGRTPCSTFKDLLREYNVELKGPFNYSTRDEVGIPREWYDPQISTEEPKKNLCKWQVYDRLSCIISMEQENSSLD